MGLDVNRRTFLKLGGSAAILVVQKSGLGSERAKLPTIPTLSGLASIQIKHVYSDLFNQPVAMNEWGYSQAAKSVSAVTAISFPPYACCGIPDVSWTPGLLISCEIFLNGQMLSICSPPGNEITYQWFPHCVVREQLVDGLRFCTKLFMPVRQRAVAEEIEVLNTSGSHRRITLAFDLRAGVTKRTEEWNITYPGEGTNKIVWNAEQGRLTFEAQHSAAASTQGIQPRANRVEGGRVLVYEITLNPGEKRTFHYVNAIAGNGTAANDIHDRLQAQFDAEMQRSEQDFQRILRSAFTPGNSEFSGHLPELRTDDESLWNLYHAGFKNLITARRNSPDSAYGPTLMTLTGHSPVPTLCFPWDTSLTALSLALLDPLQLQRTVEVWFQQDMHQHWSTDYISGKGVGAWYGVNDMAIVRCARDYLRVTGDFAWLDKRVGDKPVLEHLKEHALYWKKLQKTDHGLGDYGNVENLLEVVSTYLHEVAGMNAGNVSSMRSVAALLERRGDTSGATHLRAEAKELAERINRLLYVNGKGWWRCGQPDGTYNEVRHCYDFLTVLDCMGEDLTSMQKDEMGHFFWDQLHSEKWMRALSSGDPDATWNIRPDHSCLGAYSAWPPMSAKGLYKIDGASRRVASWLREIAKAGNQGPIGQSHFTEAVFPVVNGGAYKCPDDFPYFGDWSCISGGCFTDMVIDTLFGVDLTLYDGIRLNSHIDDFDPNAQLQGLRYQGAEYAVGKTGAIKTQTKS